MFSRRCLLALSLFSALLLPVASHAAPRYKVTVLPERFNPVDINNAGLIAGDVRVSDTQSHAALLARGKVIDLGTLGGPTSVAAAINEAGQVTGTSSTRYADTTHAFLYSRGKMIDIDRRGPGTRSIGLAINVKGHVTGQYVNRKNQPHGFLYTGNGLRDIGTLGGTVSLGWDINDAGFIAGESEVRDPSNMFPPFHPFIYRNGVMRDLGVLQTGTANAAQAINNAGQVAGYSEVNGAFHLFFYERGMMTDLGFFGGPQLTVNDMNERGAFVGTARAPGPDVGFLYSGGQLYDLSTLIVHPGGWQVQSADGINDHGQIVGRACRQITCYPVRLDPVRGHR